MGVRDRPLRGDGRRAAVGDRREGAPRTSGCRRHSHPPSQAWPVGAGEAGRSRDVTFPEGFYTTIRDEEDYDRYADEREGADDV